MDWRAAGGIGEALGGLSTGLVERRAQDRQQMIEDEQRARIKQSWDEAQQAQVGAEMTGAQKARRIADPGYFVTDQLAQHKAALFGQPTAAQPAPAPAPAAQGAPGIVAPGSALDQRMPDRKPAATPAPAPEAPAPAPVDDELKSLHDQEIGFTREAKEAEQRIHDYARQHFPGDPQAENRMLNAWMDMKEKDPDFQKWKTGVETYKTNIENQYRNQKAHTFVDAIRRGDQATITSMYGDKAQLGHDPITGLPGVDMGNGNFVGMGQVVTDGMFKAGLLDEKEFTKQTKDNSDNMNKIILELMKEKRQQAFETWKEGQANYRARLSLDRNKDIEVANEIQKTTAQLQKETDPDKRTALQAKLDSLQVKVTRANAYVSNEASLAMDRLNKTQQSKVNTLVNQANGDENKGIKPMSDEAKVQKFKELAKEDPNMAVAFALGVSRGEAGGQSPIMKALGEWQNRASDRTEAIRSRVKEAVKEPTKAPDHDTLAAAKRAIAAGASKELVKKRLEDSGFDASSL